MILCLILSARANAATDKAQPLLLDLVINGRDTGNIIELTQRGGHLFASRADLEAAGFLIPRDTPADPKTLVALNALPGLRFRENDLAQTLTVTGDARSLVGTVLGPGANQAAPPTVQTGTGAALNYSLASNYDTNARESYLAGSFDGWVFTPFGVLSSGALAYANAGPSLGITHSTVRLDTTYTYSQAAALRQFNAGDVISGSLAWSRSVRLGGLQIATDFGLQPGLVTSPLPSLSGQAAVPSTVDVLVNGIQRFSSNVDAGPFSIPQIPVVTGQGTVSVVVTDALGHQSIQTLPYYNSTMLLAPGRNSFSLEAGSVRLRYGMASDDYRDIAASASLRHGVFPWLTVEGHAETTGSLGMAGAGLDVALGNMALVTLSGAASGSYGQIGTQYQAGIQHAGRHFSVALSEQVSRHTFRDIAAIEGDPVPTRTTQASIGLPIGPFGSLGLTYSAIDQSAATVPGDPFVLASASGTDNAAISGISASGEHVSLLTGTYSITLFKRLYASITGFKDLNGSGNTGLFASLSIPLGGRTSAEIGMSDSGGSATRFVQTSRSAVSIGDIGWQAQISQGQSAQQNALLTYKSPWGLLDGGFGRVSGDTSARADWQGALAFGDGAIFAANSIQDSFAMVDTDGNAGVQVLQDNRPVGRTNGSGRLLVPNLRSYDSNPIGINPLDVPMDSDISTTARVIRPADRTGVVVKFSIQRSRGALVTLVDTKGKPLPLGAQVTLQASGKTAIVGYSGQAYLEDLSPRNKLLVTLPSNKTCKASFIFHAVKDDLPSIGPVTCRMDKAS